MDSRFGREVVTRKKKEENRNTIAMTHSHTDNLIPITSFPHLYYDLLLSLG